jgi:phosphatidate cytidylyltransferase
MELLLLLPPTRGNPTKLLFFFVLVDQISDVLQYVWGKCLGKRKIVPTISPKAYGLRVRKSKRPLSE